MFLLWINRQFTYSLQFTVYNLIFLCNRFANDLVMYGLSSLSHNLATDFALATSLSTVSPKERMIALWAFSNSSIFCFSYMVLGRFFSLSKASWSPCWTRNGLIFSLHNLKSFLPVNFSTSNFAVPIMTQRLWYQLLKKNQPWTRDY